MSINQGPAAVESRYRRRLESNIPLSPRRFWWRPFRRCSRCHNLNITIVPLTLVDHLVSFKSLILMQGANDCDMVCRVFLAALKKATWLWFFNLFLGFIGSFDQSSLCWLFPREQKAKKDLHQTFCPHARMGHSKLTLID